MNRVEHHRLPQETIEEGLYRRVNRLTGESAIPKAAIFLDRDGVLIEERNYLWKIEDAVWLPGAIDAVRRLNAIGMPVVLVTNQAGIGRGYYGWPEFRALQDWLEAHLAVSGAGIDAVYACGYHSEGRPPLDVPNHPWRKPRAGMLAQAAADLGLDLTRSWLVGDHLSDIQAALAGGLEGAIHVTTGHGAGHRPEVEQLRPDFEAEIVLAADLAEAVDRILMPSQPNY